MVDGVEWVDAVALVGLALAALIFGTCAAVGLFTLGMKMYEHRGDRG